VVEAMIKLPALGDLKSSESFKSSQRLKPLKKEENQFTLLLSLRAKLFHEHSTGYPVPHA
jgi:hypothetical protein